MSSNDNHLYRIIAHHFAQFVADQNIPEEQLPELSPVSFISWVQGQPVGEIAPPELCVAMDVGQDEIDFVLKLYSEPGAANRLLGFWPYLTLAHRGLPKHKVLTFQFVCMIQWEDGTFAPMQAYAHRDTVGAAINDAVVVQQLQSRPPAMAQLVAGVGLDELHDQHYAQGPCADEETLALLRRAASELNGREDLSEEQMGKIARFFQWNDRVFGREVPEVLKPGIADAQQEAAPAGPSKGGFNG